MPAIKTEELPRHPEKRPLIEDSNADKQQLIEDPKCSPHVSFKELSNNGIKVTPEVTQGAPLAQEESESPDDSESQKETSKKADDGVTSHADQKASSDGEASNLSSM